MFSAIGKFDELLAQGGTRFLAGEKLSIADLLFYYEMTNLVYWGLDHEKYTNVKRWFT
jgi:glutathione S-transferase